LGKHNILGRRHLVAEAAFLRRQRGGFGLAPPGSGRIGEAVCILHRGLQADDLTHEAALAAGRLAVADSDELKGERGAVAKAFRVQACDLGAD
jgi:hypothetical protein